MKPALKPVINFFLPAYLRNNPRHVNYNEAYMIATGCVLTPVILLLGELLLYFFHVKFYAFYYHALAFILFLPFIRLNLFRQMMPVLGLASYAIYFPVFLNTGGIYSANLALLYLYLIGAFYGNHKSGIYFIGSNILIFILLYYFTSASPILGSKLYALFIHSFCTIFIGIVFWTLHKEKDIRDTELRILQQQQIDYLDEEVRLRTTELNNMRQILAADFHDETGNLLSAITRQAELLKLKEADDAHAVIDNIISSSNELYNSSRHFLWNLNQENDDPEILFDYITSFGQSFYNKFDISFSAENTSDAVIGKLRPFAAINLIFIFKEAMNNVVKHSGANDVLLKMSSHDQGIAISLTDNGVWKEPDESSTHHGLSNIEKRCTKNNLTYMLNRNIRNNTRLEILIPVIPQRPFEEHQS